MIARPFHILTFGCQMNVNDSFWLQSALMRHGFYEAELHAASVICLNTCSVREKPEQRVRQMLTQIAGETKNNPGILVCVLGCVAQQLGKALFSFPQVRLVAGSDNLFAVPEAIERCLLDPSLHLSLCDFTTCYVERQKGLSLPTGPVAYVNIMQGCDNFCTYCIVPYTRGRQRSRSASAILAECEEKLANGARELVLLGQNVNAYGKDKKKPLETFPSFATLCSDIAALPGLQRLRYTSPHPKDMTEEDIAAFRDLSPLCPSLHLPLQSGSTKVLARMGRGYTADDFCLLVEKLKKACPGIALTTDLIVGFPGESEEDFTQTLALMRICHFTASYSFCYSDRPPAKAATFSDKIEPGIQHERLLRLQALQEELTSAWLATRVGENATLLIESKSKRDHFPGENWQGRDEFGTMVHLALPEKIEHRGEMVSSRIKEAGKHCLFAEQVDSPR